MLFLSYITASHRLVSLTPLQFKLQTTTRIKEKTKKQSYSGRPCSIAHYCSIKMNTGKAMCPTCQSHRSFGFSNRAFASCFRAFAHTLPSFEHSEFCTRLTHPKPSSHRLNVTHILNKSLTDAKTTEVKQWGRGGL